MKLEAGLITKTLKPQSEGFSIISLKLCISITLLLNTYKLVEQQEKENAVDRTLSVVNSKNSFRIYSKKLLALQCKPGPAQQFI
jgi:hypothetical protein